MNENEHRAGIVKVPLATLQFLFGDGRVVRAAVTDDDFATNTISLVVEGHPDLPQCRPGQRLQVVERLTAVSIDGTRHVSFPPHRS